MINRVLLNGLEDQEYEVTPDVVINVNRVCFGIRYNPDITDDLFSQLPLTDSLTFINEEDKIEAIQNGVKFLAFSFINDGNDIYSIEFEKKDEVEDIQSRIAALEESTNAGSTGDHTMETLVITTQAAPGTSTYFESKIKETSTVVGAPIDSVSGMTVPGITIDPHDGFITITNQTGEYRTVKITLVTII